MLNKLLFIILLSIVTVKTTAQEIISHNFTVESYCDLLFDDIKFNSELAYKGIIIFNKNTNSYNVYPTKHNNVFARIKPMYHVELELNNQADSFNPYNVKSPFESITIGLSKFIFDKIQHKD